MPDRRPRILFLVDRPRRAQARTARAISRHLADEFDCRVVAAADAPDLAAWPCDLLHVGSWDTTWHRQFDFEPHRVVRSVTSQSWAGSMSPGEFASKWLADAGTVTCCSERLRELIAPHRRVHVTPLGFDPFVFPAHPAWRGSLRFGWAGDRQDPSKGVDDILFPALEADGVDPSALAIAGGNLQLGEMGSFFRSIDVVAVASEHEGAPLTLIEAMASGCFPICTDVGLVPELVQHGDNGLIVARDVDAFREAFAWCRQNADLVRSKGLRNAEQLRRRRTWGHVAERWREVFRGALAIEPAGRCERALGRSSDRTERAAAMIHRLPVRRGDNLIDLGCGHQALRARLPDGLRYVPVDRERYSDDCRLVDLDQAMPPGTFRVASLIGVLEYLQNPERLLHWVSDHADFAVVSFHECRDATRRRAQGWGNDLGLRDIERILRSLGATRLETMEIGPEERVYSIAFTSERIAGGAPSGPISRVALLTDHYERPGLEERILEFSVQRLLSPHCEIERGPLRREPNDAEFERIASCDIVITVGGELETILADGSALAPRMIERLGLPVLPLGTRCSARVDTIGAELAMLDDYCERISVRDAASRRWLQQAGITTAEVTGSPILFWRDGLRTHAPRGGEESPIVVLRGAWLESAVDAICDAWQPRLLVSDVEDFRAAARLVGRHGVEVIVSGDNLVERFTRASRVLALRANAGMLSLSLGGHVSFVAGDPEIESMCELVRAPLLPDDRLVEELTGPAAPFPSVVGERIAELRDAMRGVLASVGLTDPVAERVAEPVAEPAG